MAKKRLTKKQKIKLEQKKGIKRMVRRMKTLEKNGVELKRSATKRTAQRYIDLNKDVDWTDRDSVNDFINSAVNSTRYFDRKSETAKELKEKTGYTFKKLEGMNGAQVHDAIADALDAGMSRDAVAKAFGYEHL